MQEVSIANFQQGNYSWEISIFYAEVMTTGYSMLH